MDRLTLEQFFAQKLFEVPIFQRDFAWDISHVEDLLEDIQEAIDLGASHYIGTFVLSKPDKATRYHLVDGQQRLTTLTMIIHALVERLDGNAKIINTDKFLREGSDGPWRLELMGPNSEFFHRLLEGEEPEPQTSSHGRLLRAYRCIKDRVQALYEKDESWIGRYVDCVRNLQVMQFTESNAGRAIRIFQTVNDRGKPLTNLEKAKSLLIYYSNRFLSGALDGKINEDFGCVFRSYARIKELGENPDHPVDLISRKRFTEDSVMRYHFLAFKDSASEDHYDFEAAASYVHDEFLKATLKGLRPEDRRADLKRFIDHYVTDLRAFYGSLERALERMETSPQYYKLFVILGLSARLYPLLGRLETMGLLDAEVPECDEEGVRFIDLIERADVRVYKTRGTDPRKDVSELAWKAQGMEPSEVASELAGFVKKFMSDSEFTSRLDGEVYGNVALPHILIRFGEENGHGPPHRLGIDELRKLARSQPTVEHILAQDRPFPLPGRGFTSEEEYAHEVQRLGNLTVLEKRLNSACQGLVPESKAKIENGYCKSRFKVTQRLVQEMKVQDQSFRKQEIEARTQKLMRFCTETWPLW